MHRIALLLLLTAPAHADVGEASLRPFFELRLSEAEAPEGRVDAMGMGGGLLGSYGLSFDWSLTLRYGFERTGGLQVSESTPNGEVSHSWVQERHLGTVGVSWAPSDQLTPVVQLEGGVAWVRVVERLQRMQKGGRIASTNDPLRVIAAPSDTNTVLPAGRASVSLEWRFLDFWSVAAGPVAEYAGGFAWGGQIWLAAYRYL